MADPYAFDQAEMRHRFMLGAMYSPRVTILRRPSWLHPIKRVLWVHHHGPERPEVRITELRRGSLSVLKGLTNY